MTLWVMQVRNLPSQSSVHEAVVVVQVALDQIIPSLAIKMHHVGKGRKLIRCVLVGSEVVILRDNG